MKFLILALALGVHADYLRQEQNDDNVDPCGNPTDVCMNQDNWNKCRSLIESGCQMLEIMESCPLQFACGDDDEERKLTDYAEDDVSVDKKSKACVSIFVYEDKKCRGEPVRSITLPTWTKPGSPCFTDATMPVYSVKDHYCDLDRGNWHETVYVNTRSCDLAWYKPWVFPVNLTFTPDSCLYGLKLDYCKKGRCPRPDGDEQHTWWEQDFIEEVTREAMALNQEA